MSSPLTYPFVRTPAAFLEDLTRLNVPTLPATYAGHYQYHQRDYAIGIQCFHDAVDGWLQTHSPTPPIIRILTRSLQDSAWTNFVKPGTLGETLFAALLRCWQTLDEPSRLLIPVLSPRQIEDFIGHPQAWKHCPWFNDTWTALYTAATVRPGLHLPVLMTQLHRWLERAEDNEIYENQTLAAGLAVTAPRDTPTVVNWIHTHYPPKSHGILFACPHLTLHEVTTLLQTHQDYWESIKQVAFPQALLHHGSTLLTQWTGRDALFLQRFMLHLLKRHPGLLPAFPPSEQLKERLIALVLNPTPPDELSHLLIQLRALWWRQRQIPNVSEWLYTHWRTRGLTHPTAYLEYLHTIIAWGRESGHDRLATQYLQLVATWYTCPRSPFAGSVTQLEELMETLVHLRPPFLPILPQGAGALQEQTPPPLFS